MRLGSSIEIIPFMHGKYVFANAFRNIFLSQRFDCLAVDIPGIFSEDVKEAVDILPTITAVVGQSVEGPRYYVPIDPCDATIEAVRQGAQNHVPVHFIGDDHSIPPTPLPLLPDEYALQTLGFEEYCSLCIRTIGNKYSTTHENDEALSIASKLHDLESKYQNILVLVHFRHFIRVIHHYTKEYSYNQSFSKAPTYHICTRTINPDHLYFALGELPFFSGKSEKIRFDPLQMELSLQETTKQLFTETRDDYSDSRDEAIELSPTRIQVALTYLRNLTHVNLQMSPSLFDIVTAAKGVGGNRFALRILKNAKYYPYLSFDPPYPLVSVGLDKIRYTEEPNPVRAFNLFRDKEMRWQTLSIKPDPTTAQRKKYRYHWNPSGMCSHVPEDRKIENFNAHLRQKTMRVLSEDLVSSEKFTTSVKDGIDIRETMRNWHTGQIYVKELPPAKGAVDTVVILFDEGHDDKYPHFATWYAEHDEESTLTFYATDPFEDIIGPGICRSWYGGLSLTFPPRSIPNIFELPQSFRYPTLAMRLTYGAVLFSKEKNIAFVSAKKPSMKYKQIARRAQKHLVWLPLSNFSNETLRKLRTFHILNGKEVRSWAGRFIGD